MSALALTARADTYTWADPTVSGTWDSSAGLWLLDGAPVAYLPQSGSNTVDVVIGDGEHAMTFTYGWGGTVANAGTVDTRNSLTVNAGVTLDLAVANPRITYNTVTNNGLMQMLPGASRIFSVQTGGQGTVQFINSGTVRLGNAGNNLTIGGIVTNTGGLIDVAAGATLLVITNNYTLATGHGIYGGALTMAASSTFSLGNNIQGNLMFADLNYANAGFLLDTSGNGITSSSRQLTYTATDGRLANSGTISVWQSPNHDFTGTNDIHTAYFHQSGGNVFTNSGLISVLNESVTGTYANSAASYRELGAAFSVQNNGAAGGSFTNSGRIDIRNTAHGDTTGTTYARLTVSAGANFTNSGTIAISLGADTTDDALHTATLLVAEDWTNTGVIIVDRANKTLAMASLDLTGQTYTQTGADAATRLLNGGRLEAAAVNISGGTLAGAGEVLAATTIGNGGVLDPAGTLTFSSLTLNAGAILDFDAAASDLLQVNGDLNLNGGALSLSGYTGDDPLLLANYTGSLLGTDLAVGDDYALDFSITGKIYLATIPEPNGLALLLTGTAALLFIPRRRQK
jgi:hypothetical protein